MARSQYKTIPDFSRLIPLANLFRRRQRALRDIKLGGLGVAVSQVRKSKALKGLKRGGIYQRNGMNIRF